MRRLETSKMPEHSRRSNEGFSLIELLVVVAVILVVTAIAVPNFIKAKMLSNESSALQSLRSISTAEILYSTTFGVGFSTNITQLSGTGVNPDQNNAGLIDETLASGIKSGYVFTYTPLTTDAQGHTTTYSLAADPQSSTTGQRHFYTELTGVIRSNISVPAGPSDLPI